MVGATVSGGNCLTFAPRLRPRLCGPQPWATVCANCWLGCVGHVSVLSSRQPSTGCHITFLCGRGGAGFPGNKDIEPLGRIGRTFSMVGATVSGGNCLSFASCARPRLGESQPWVAMWANCWLGVRGLPHPRCLRGALVQGVTSLFRVRDVV